MSRRASAKLHPIHIAAVLLLLTAAVVGGWYVAGQVADPFRTIPRLDVEAYLENANTLRGNVYKIEASIANQLAWEPDGARLFAIEQYGAASGELAAGAVLPLLVPPTHKSLNIQKGQHYHIEVEVVEGGLLKTLSLVKS